MPMIAKKYHHQFCRSLMSPSRSLVVTTPKFCVYQSFTFLDCFKTDMIFLILQYFCLRNTIMILIDKRLLKIMIKCYEIHFSLQNLNLRIQLFLLQSSLNNTALFSCENQITCWHILFCLCADVS